eukprot:scaffold382226_cov19-Prasinocladus_malaysianus.AAC.1
MHARDIFLPAPVVDELTGFKSARFLKLDMFGSVAVRGLLDLVDFALVQLSSYGLLSLLGWNNQPISCD